MRIEVDTADLAPVSAALVGTAAELLGAASAARADVLLASECGPAVIVDAVAGLLSRLSKNLAQAGAGADQLGRGVSAAADQYVVTDRTALPSPSAQILAPTRPQATPLPQPGLPPVPSRA
jgi:hypothetical protein